jgi:acyl carrier protein
MAKLIEIKYMKRLKDKLKKKLIKSNLEDKNLKILNKIFYDLKGKKYNSKNKITDILDSIEVFNLISEIEKKFKIKFKPEKINEKYFSSLSSIIKLINEIQK